MGSEAITANDLRGILSSLSTITLPRVESGLTGEIRMYAGSEEPIGWLLCDGRAISRTTYAELFAAIGTTYGAGDGNTTFNIPDFRGRFPLSTGNNHALADTGGAEGAWYHRHKVNRFSYQVNRITSSSSYTIADVYQGDYSDYAGSTNNQLPADVANMPPFITVNFIICYQGVNSTNSNIETYSLSKSGNIITLTGSAGNTSSVVDGNTTYGITASGNTILLTDSSGNIQTATVSGGGGGGSFSAIVVVLTPSDWSNNSQTTTATGVTSSSTIIISPALESFDEYMECNVKCTTQGTDSLTFTCDFVPSTTLMVNVLIG